MRYTWTSLILGVAAFSATFVVTQNTAFCQRGGRGGGGGGWDFVAKKYDKNSDGKVSMEEYTRGAEGFKALDTNEDGSITEDDWSGQGRRERGDAPQVGQVAPDFTLTHIADADKQATLSSLAGKKPVALIFGSCT